MRVFIPAFLLALVAALHIPTSTSAQTDVDCVAIVDSVGTKVGRVITASAAQLFYKGHNGFAVPLWLFDNAITGISSFIYFTDANCSSTPFVEISFGIASPTSAVIGQDVYYSEPTAVPQNVQALLTCLH